jgi:ribosomal protein L7/L12
MLLTENTQRLLRIEAKLDAIFNHLKIEFDPDQAIRKLAKKGDKIGAIRLHRSAHGSDLAEAKRQVEAIG